MKLKSYRLKYYLMGIALACGVAIHVANRENEHRDNSSKTFGENDESKDTNRQESSLERASRIRRDEIKRARVEPADIPGRHALTRLFIARQGPSRPKFHLLDPSGKISLQSEEYYRLTREEKEFLQTGINELMASIKSEIAREIKEDPSRSDEEKGITSYVIPSIEDFSHSEFDKFVFGMGDVFTKNRLGEILVSLQVENLYGGMGQWKGVISIEERAPDPDNVFNDNESIVHFEMIDATSGEVTSKASVPASRINFYFPGLFDFSE